MIHPLKHCANSTSFDFPSISIQTQPQNPVREQAQERHGPAEGRAGMLSTSVAIQLRIMWGLGCGVYLLVNIQKTMEKSTIF